MIYHQQFLNIYTSSQCKSNANEQQKSQEPDESTTSGSGDTETTGSEDSNSSLPNENYFCNRDKSHASYGKLDTNREWNQSRIVDMIWWNSINKFICATNNGIYSVEYIDDRFRILNVLNGRWMKVRVAANTAHLWINEKEKIMVYNVNFQFVRLIHLKIPPSIANASFCLTNSFVAFAFLRRVLNCAMV